MNTNLTSVWLILAVIIVLGVIAAIYAYKNRGKTRPDYYTFFVMGVVWLIIGIPFKMWLLATMGAIFAAIGLINKDKWKTNRRTWKDLSNKEKRFKISLIIILSLLVIAGLVFYLLADKELL